MKRQRQQPEFAPLLFLFLVGKTVAICGFKDGAVKSLLDVDPTMHRDATSFHHHIVIDKFKTGIPARHFLRRPAQREREFFVAGLERAIAKIAQNPRSFFLSGAAVVNNVLRERSFRGSFRAPTQHFRE